MATSTTIFILGILVIGIWIFIEIKRLKHKMLAIFLIGLILFTYISFTVTMRKQDLDLKTIPGMISAGKLYFVWLGGIFTNAKSITLYVAKHNWSEQKEITVTDPPEKTETENETIIEENEEETIEENTSQTELTEITETISKKDFIWNKL
jgi:hypothetical protein